MAWYTQHYLRHRGRLVEVGTRYGSLNGAKVVKGKPLDLREGSRDYYRLWGLFNRSQAVKREINDFLEAWNS